MKKTSGFFLFLTAVLLSFLSPQTTANPDRSYCRFSANHTMCGPSKFGQKCGSQIPMRGITQSDIRLILNEHNAYRSRIAMGQEGRGMPGPQPPAANMLALTWDPELARIAQRHADQCIFDHECRECRRTVRFDVGQNLYISYYSHFNENREWSRAMRSWYDEVAEWKPQHIKPFVFSQPLGHYTQMAWWNTRKIGCGMTMFQEDGWWKKLYTCNYGPGGNILRTEMYEIGEPCSKCPHGTKCSNKFPGLCEIDTNSISNGGSFHTDNSLGSGYGNFNFQRPINTQVYHISNVNPNSNLFQVQFQEFINRLRGFNQNSNFPLQFLKLNSRKITNNVGDQTTKTVIQNPLRGSRIQKSHPILKIMQTSPMHGNRQQKTVHITAKMHNKDGQHIKTVRKIENIVKLDQINNPEPQFPNTIRSSGQISSHVPAKATIKTENMPLKDKKSRLLIDQNGGVLEVLEFGSDPSKNNPQSIKIVDGPNFFQDSLQQIDPPSSPLMPQIEDKDTQERKKISDNEPKIINTKIQFPNLQPQINKNAVDPMIKREESSSIHNPGTTTKFEETLSKRQGGPSLTTNSIDDGNGFQPNDAVTIPAAVLKLLPKEIQSTIQRLKTQYDKNPSSITRTTAGLNESKEKNPGNNGITTQNNAENLITSRNANPTSEIEQNIKEGKSQIDVDEAITALEEGSKIPNSKVLRTKSLSDLKKILDNVPQGIKPLVLYKYTNGDVAQIDPETLNPSSK